MCHRAGFRSQSALTQHKRDAHAFLMHYGPSSYEHRGYGVHPPAYPIDMYYHHGTSTTHGPGLDATTGATAINNNAMKLQAGVEEGDVEKVTGYGT